MVFSSKINKYIVSRIQMDIKRNYKLKIINKRRYYYYKCLEKLNDVKIVLTTALTTFLLVVIFIIDATTINFWGIIAIEYWIMFLAIFLPPVLIWYTTIKLENEKRLTEIKIELLNQIIELRIEAYSINLFSSMSKDELYEYEEGYKREFLTDGSITSVSKMVTNSRLKIREAMLIFMSLEFNNCNSAIAYCGKEIMEINEINNKYIKLSDWDQIILESNNQLELCNYLEHVLRQYK